MSYQRHGRKVLTLLFVVLCGCQGSSSPRVGVDPALADTLKQLIASAYDFTRPDVVQRMSALYPDSGQVVSASGGQLQVGADSVRAGLRTFWQNVGRNMREARWKWGAVYVERLGPDAAVLTGTWTIPHVAPDGKAHVIGGAWTAVFRRIGGRWRIVQEHLSGPG